MAEAEGAATGYGYDAPIVEGGSSSGFGGTMSKVAGIAGSLFGGGGGTTGAVAGVAGQAMNAITGKSAGPSRSGDLSDRSPIHIAPVGMNLGAIMAPFNEGSPENGGWGIETPNRYRTMMASVPSFGGSSREGVSMPMVALIAGAGILTVFMLMR